jgi:hypothetical protein
MSFVEVSCQQLSEFRGREFEPLVDTGKKECMDIRLLADGII